MKITWDKTLETRIEIFPLILASLILWYIFDCTFWLQFGGTLILLKLLDIIYDIIISIYKHYKK